MEILLLILAIIGGLALGLQFFDIAFKYFPYLPKFRAATLLTASDIIKTKRLKKKAIAAGIDSVVNQAVYELRDELPDGWINRASIEWVRADSPSQIKDRQLILRIRPDDDQDNNYLNAIYYFFAHSIFPQTAQMIPADVRRAASLHLTQRTVAKKHPFLEATFRDRYLNQIKEDEIDVAGYFGDFARIDRFGFFNSAFIREVDTLAESLRFSHERQNIQNEINNIVSHLLGFEKLGMLRLQEQEWYRSLSATSYGFILVANPTKQIQQGIKPYINRAHLRLRLGIKRLYVLGCQAERSFFEEVLHALTDIRDYRLAETFKLSNDYRGNPDGLGALFIIDPIRDSLAKFRTDRIDELDELDELPPLLTDGIEQTMQSSVILSEDELRQLFNDIVREKGNENGWAFLGDVGNVLRHRNPLFNAFHYGCSSMLGVVKKLGTFEIDARGSGPAKAVFVRPIEGTKRSVDPRPFEYQNVKELDLNNLSSNLIYTTRQCYQNGGWADLSSVGYKLRSRFPAFSPEQFGAKNLRSLMESTGEFLFDAEGLVVFARVKADESTAE